MKSKPESGSRYEFRITVLKLVVAAILLPLLPLAVAINFLDTADQLSPFPGIKHGGGLGSAIVTLVYIVILISTVTGALAVATGGNVPIVSSPDTTQTPTSTPEPTPTQTPALTSTETRISTPTPSPAEAEVRDDYEALRQQYLDHWSGLDVEHPATPALLGIDARPNQDTLWVVFDETDVHENATRMRLEWTTVANAYLHSLESHTGHAPERMIAIGWNNTGPITYFRVETDNARALIDGDIEYNTFYNSFFRTLRPTSEGERRLARDIAEHPPDDN